MQSHLVSALFDRIDLRKLNAIFPRNCLAYPIVSLVLCAVLAGTLVQRVASTADNQEWLTLHRRENGWQSAQLSAAHTEKLASTGYHVNAKAALLKMHEIDSLYDKVRRRILLLNRAAEGSKELDLLREEVDSIDQELQGTRTEQQDLELESRSLTDRIRESESSLMSGELSNPRELEALQSSIESMKEHRTDLENRSVERLVMVDSLQATLENKRTNLVQVEEEWTNRKNAFETEIEQRKKEFLYLKKAREQVAEMLTEENLEMYEHLRRRKNGVAVALLEDEICGACHTQVAVGILNNIRYSDDLLSCPSCGRILLTEV